MNSQLIHDAATKIAEETLRTVKDCLLEHARVRTWQGMMRDRAKGVSYAND